MKFIDLTGVRFGRLVVLNRHGTSYPTRWLCRCDCGKEYISTGGHLKAGDIVSCGCFRASVLGHGSPVIHGHATGGINGNPTREYHTWRSMKDRCYRPGNNKYEFYGGKGVTVCERWLNSFEDFLADMGSRPKGTTIDRIKSDGNYEKDNCKWSTRAEQARNTSQNRMIEFRGRTQCLMDWAGGDRRVYAILYQRLERDWSVDKTLTAPIQNSNWRHQPQIESKADAEV